MCPGSAFTNGHHCSGILVPTACSWQEKHFPSEPATREGSSSTAAGTHMLFVILSLLSCALTPLRWMQGSRVL